MVLEYLYDYFFGKDDKKQKNKQKEDMFKRLELQDITETKDEFFKKSVDILEKTGGALTLLNPPSTIGAIATTLLKGKALEKAKELTFNKGFQYYGNWGGPNWSGKRFFKPGEIITEEDIKNNPAIDKLDELYKKHDLAYQLASTFDTPEKRKQETRRADEIFIKNAEKLIKTGELDITQTAYGKASILAFRAKLATDLGYDIPQESNPEASKISRKYLDLLNYEDPKFIEIPKKISNNEPSKNTIKNKDIFKNLSLTEKNDLIDYLLDDE